MVQGLIQIVLTLIILVVIVPFLGNYLARVFLFKKQFLILF